MFLLLLSSASCFLLLTLLHQGAGWGLELAGDTIRAAEVALLCLAAGWSN